MSLDNMVSAFSALLSFIGLLLVVTQFRQATRQREAESLVKLTDINRELISLGFDHPELFPILEDAPCADPVRQRRYLQLWLNQLSLIHLYVKHSVTDKDLRESLERSLADFMTLKNMRQQWQTDRYSYPASFQKLVDAIILKSKPAPATARDVSQIENLPGDLLKRVAFHSHEGFAAWRGQNSTLGWMRNISLHKYVAVIGQYSGGTDAAIAQCRQFPVFPDNFLNFHGLIGFFKSLKQNHAFCFTNDPRGALV